MDSGPHRLGDLDDSSIERTDNTVMPETARSTVVTDMQQAATSSAGDETSFGMSVKGGSSSSGNAEKPETPTSSAGNDTSLGMCEKGDSSSAGNAEMPESSSSAAGIETGLGMTENAGSSSSAGNAEKLETPTSSAGNTTSLDMSENAGSSSVADTAKEKTPKKVQQQVQRSMERIIKPVVPDTPRSSTSTSGMKPAEPKPSSSVPGKPAKPKKINKAQGESVQTPTSSSKGPGMLKKNARAPKVTEAEPSTSTTTKNPKPRASSSSAPTQEEDKGPSAKKGRKGKKGKKAKSKEDVEEAECDGPVDIDKLISESKASADALFRQVCEIFDVAILDTNKDIPIEMLVLNHEVRPVEQVDVEKLVDPLHADLQAALAEYERVKMFCSELPGGRYKINDGNHRTGAAITFNTRVEDALKIKKLKFGYVLDKELDSVQISYLTSILEREARKFKTNMKKRDLARNARLLLRANPLPGTLNASEKDQEAVKRIQAVYQPEEAVLPAIRRFSFMSDEDFSYVYKYWHKFNEGMKFWGPVLNNYPECPEGVMKLLKEFNTELPQYTNDSLATAVQGCKRELIPMLKAHDAWIEGLDDEPNLMYFNTIKKKKQPDTYICDDYEDFIRLITRWVQDKDNRVFSNLGRRIEDTPATRRDTLRKNFRTWARKHMNDDEGTEEPKKAREAKKPATVCILRPNCYLCEVRLDSPVAAFRKDGNEAAAALFVWAQGLAGNMQCPALQGTYAFYKKYLDEDGNFIRDSLIPKERTDPNVVVDEEQGTFFNESAQTDRLETSAQTSYEEPANVLTRADTPELDSDEEEEPHKSVSGGSDDSDNEVEHIQAASVRRARRSVPFEKDPSSDDEEVAADIPPKRSARLSFSFDDPQSPRRIEFSPEYPEAETNERRIRAEPEEATPTEPVTEDGGDTRERRTSEASEEKGVLTEVEEDDDATGGEVMAPKIGPSLDPFHSERTGIEAMSEFEESMEDNVVSADEKDPTKSATQPFRKRKASESLSDEIPLRKRPAKSGDRLQRRNSGTSSDEEDKAAERRLKNIL